LPPTGKRRIARNSQTRCMELRIPQIDKPPKGEYRGQMRFTKVTTRDGSTTLFDARVGESYKSGHAARTETEAVFLTPGVVEHPQRLSASPFRILELGLGLGTNMTTLYEWWKRNPEQS